MDSGRVAAPHCLPHVSPGSSTADEQLVSNHQGQAGDAAAAVVTGRPHHYLSCEPPRYWASMKGTYGDTLYCPASWRSSEITEHVQCGLVVIRMLM